MTSNPWENGCDHDVKTFETEGGAWQECVKCGVSEALDA